MGTNKLDNQRNEVQINTVNTARNGLISPFSVGHYFAKSLALTLVVVFLISILEPEAAYSKREPISFGSDVAVEVYPTETEADSWASSKRALVRDLDNDSLYQNFTAKNSSFIAQERIVIPTAKKRDTVEPSTVVNDLEIEPVVSSSSDSGLQEQLQETVSNTAAIPEEVQTVEVTDEQVQEDKTEIEDFSATTSQALYQTPWYLSQTIRPSVGKYPLLVDIATSTTDDLVVDEETLEQEEVQDSETSTPEIAVIETDNESLPEEVAANDVTSATSTDVVPEEEVSVANAVDSELVDNVVDFVPEEPLGSTTSSQAATTTEVLPTESLDSQTTNINTGESDERIDPVESELVVTDFDLPKLQPGQFITDAQLRVSMAAKLKTPAADGEAPYIEVLYGASTTQQTVGVVLLEEEISNALNGGYFLFALPDVTSLTDLEDISISVVYRGDVDLLDGMFLDAAWIELQTKVVTNEDIERRGSPENLQHLKIPEAASMISKKLNFTRSEAPEFTLQYISQRNALVRGFRSILRSDMVEVENVLVSHKSYGPMPLQPEVSVTPDGKFDIKIPDAQLVNLRPGEYEIELTLNEGGKQTIDTFSFQWGILTINSNKTEYATGESVNFSVGAITPTGHTICSANIDLYVTDPAGVIERLPVVESGLCDGNNVIDVPDFLASSTAGIPGEYKLYLERLSDDGEVLSFTSDTFRVVETQDVSISREGPTRIYPPAAYPMILTVDSSAGFDGTLTERVPKDFEIFDTDASITIDNDDQVLTWDVSVSAGESIEVSYQFDAPDISPFLFVLGAAELQGDVVRTASTTGSSNISFVEHRQWQIASDAVGKMLLFWDSGASIPTDWVCVSCAPADPFYQRFIVASSTYNNTGGAATHTHTAVGSVLGSAAASTESGSGAVAPVSHTHTYTPTISSESNLPEYRQLRVIRYDVAAGEPTTIPAGAIAMFDTASSSLPAGWNRYAAQDGKYVYGEDTPGTTAGSNTHTHGITGTTANAAGAGTRIRGGGSQQSGATDTHNHTVNSNSDSVDNQPPFIEILLAELSADDAPPNGLIAMWDEDVDGGWVSVSDDGDAFSNRFIKAAATYGATGDVQSHTHADALGITSSGPSATINARSGSSGSAGAHTHQVDATDFSTDDHLPPYVTVRFGKRQGVDPVYTQLSSRWYANAASLTPTEPWPNDGGGVDLIEREPITATSTPVADGDVVRLRLNTEVTNATSTIGSDFKLQFAEASVCSFAATWTDVGDVASAAIWRGYNVGGIADGATLPSTLLSSSTVVATYEEDALASSTPNEIAVSDVGEWDFVLEHNGASAGTQYCFRLVQADGTVFFSYNHYPQLLTNFSPDTLTLDKPFISEKTASTTQEFYFTAFDDEGDNVHYSIEIDDDPAFGSPLVAKNTISNSSQFENQVLVADKAPFRHGEQMKFTPVVSFTDGTTYYWRIQARDPEGSNSWGNWSEIYNFTVDATLLATAWFQTENEQFQAGALDGVEVSGDSVQLITGSTTGTLTSESIVFFDGVNGTVWEDFVFTDVETTGSISYQIEYYDGSAWSLVPDSALPGNSSGFGTSPVPLLDVDTGEYDTLRVVATFTNSGGSPTLQDWTINWGYKVETPTIFSLFANEQVGTTTPTFEFVADDPQSEDLTYQISWSTDRDFAASTTRTSDVDGGFTNIVTGADTSPFNANERIRFEIQPADALTGTTTYWWRVRAKDPTGDNVYSFWTVERSLTVIPGTDVSTWFQTTKDQFDTDILSGTISTEAGYLTVATTATEAMIVYGEGIETEPRYRLWTGTVLSEEGTLLDISAPLKWSVVKAAPTREEYIAVTLGTDADINAQTYTIGEWRSQQELTTSVSDISARGFDVEYETLSGDAIAVYCDGDADPSYYVWDGTTWTSGGTINVAETTNCTWIELAANPTSDEMVIMVRGSDGNPFEAQVWDGSAWGNPTTLGRITESAYAGMALEYEESGGQAVIVASDGNPARFTWSSWNGTAWSAAANQTIGNDFEWGSLVRDEGSDDMALCLVDDTSDIAVVRWDGAAWTLDDNLETASVKTEPSFDCSFETTSGRDNHIMLTYSDATATNYQTYNNTAWSAETQVNTIINTATMQLERMGEGLILGAFLDNANDTLRFSTWNGSSWSTTVDLVTNVSVDTSPYGRPYDIGARQPGSTGSTIVSPPVYFEDGTGPYWQEFAWNDFQPGTSEIRYFVQYLSATNSWQMIPPSDLPVNELGTTTSPIDLSGLDRFTYNVVRPFAELACDGSGNCPEMYDWAVTWAAGLTISGTAQGYDQSTNVTSGNVVVAVNGVLQAGKVGTISAGVWSIDNVTVFPGDIVTVFVSGAADAAEAVGVTLYDGIGDIDGFELYERHVSIGSNDATSTPLTNLDIGSYTFTNDEDVFLSLSGSVLNTCADAGCTDAELYIKSGALYQPEGDIITHDFENNGSFTLETHSMEVSGSWENSATTSLSDSTVLFSALVGNEVIDNTGATTTFGSLTFGSTTSSAIWTVSPLLDVNGNLTVETGTLARATTSINVVGDITTGATGFWTGIGTTTLDGNSASIWSDKNVTLQNIGHVVIDGSSKIISLGSDVAAQSITIGIDDTLDASSNNYDLYVYGDWTNNNAFVARQGEVFFVATTTSHVIISAADAFYDLSFTGVGGSWSFAETEVFVNNNLTIATGTVTLPTATTTIDGSFDSTGGAFLHNNGVLYFTSDGPENITFDGAEFTNVAHNMTFEGAGTWTMTDTNATSTNDVNILQGSVLFPSGVFAIGGSLVADSGSFDGGTGTTRFYSSVAEVLTTSGSSFNNVVFDGIGSWSFSDTNALATGDLFVYGGALTLPDTFTIGGSYDNQATVSAGTSLVVFDSLDNGETIDFGADPLHDVLIASETGGWTVVSSATTTGTFTLASSSDFTMQSGESLSVAGEFHNYVGGASTTWTGSTLSLEAGAYSINNETDPGDTYGTIRVANDTDIKMWNSDAVVYDVDATGSLYSQDHGAIDGDLYIFGNYNIAGGNEYWSYATDFDGTDLAALSAQRQANVRFADGASADFDSVTFEIIGDFAASTTVANQGSGTYNVTVSGGTFDAQYHTFSNLGSTGLSLLDAVSVGVFENGSYQVDAVAGTALTLSSTTIDANPANQLYEISFSTTSAIFATNVSQTDGTPLSYWWFRSGAGNLYGESNDSDTGDPGSIRFDDSLLVITMAGTVYADAGVTPLGGPTCDGATAVVNVYVEGNPAPYTGSCDAGTGAYSISGITIVGDPALTIYLNNAAGGEQGSIITRTPTANILDADIYANRVIVRHEDLAALTINQLAVRDNSEDVDLQFVAATNTDSDTLTVLSGNELYVWASTTFTPGGEVTLAGEGAGTSYDGSLTLADNATFNAFATSTLAIGGRFTLGASSTFNAASTTVLMNASTTGKLITAGDEVTFNNLTFDGAGGGWALTADIRVLGDVLMTDGVLSGNGDIYVESGDFAGAGTVLLNGGTTTMAVANNLGGAGSWTFHNLQLGDTLSVGTTTPLFTSTTTIGGVLTIEMAHFLDAGSTIWDLAGTGVVFVEEGTFLADTSTVVYSGPGSEVLATEYYNLTLAASGAPATYTTGTPGIIVDNDLVIAGVAATTFDQTTNDPQFDINGDVTIESNGVWVLSDLATTTIAGSYDNNGVLTAGTGTLTFDGSGAISVAAGSSDFANVVIDATGDVTVTEHATATDSWLLTDANTFTLNSGQTLSVGGTFFNDIGGAPTTWTGSTLRLYGGNNYAINASTTADSYATLEVDGTTQVRMWNSDALSYTVDTTASLYSQDHSNVDGDLYIWGSYNQTAANDHWSYATDFDGTSLAGSERIASVYIADNGSVTITGGQLSVLGSASASSTVENQGSGTYALTIGGTASSTFDYYTLSDLNIDGLVITGSASIGSLSHGSIGVSQTGGSAVTVGGTAITANPAKAFTLNQLYLDGAASGFGATATGTSVSSWRFTNHYGDIAGEGFDVDPDGDPGYVSWDDSAANITISGTVYSDEGVTTAGASVCDGATTAVNVVVAGLTTYSSTCDGSGVYSVTGVTYSPGDSIIAYLLPATGEEGATVTADPVSNISNFDIYQNRVIVRHEATDPLTIADMSVWDSSDDAAIPFTAVDSAPDTLTVDSGFGLIVWTDKTFAPQGDMTVTGGSALDYDGTLKLLSGSTFDGGAAEVYSLGGSLISETDATFDAQTSSTTFTSSSAGRTVDTNDSGFYNLAFAGSGDWTMLDGDINNNFLITDGTVTLPSSTTTVSGSFVNSGGAFDANSGTLLFDSAVAGKTVTFGGSDANEVLFSGPGTWTMSDTTATATASFIVVDGTVTLPTGTLTVAGDFVVDGTIAHAGGEVVLTSTTGGNLVTLSGNDLNSLTIAAAAGDYTLIDMSASLLDSLTLTGGTFTVGTGTLAIGGSFDVSGGTYSHASGTLLFNSNDAGEFIDPGANDLYNVVIAGTGGWTLTDSATTTNNFSLSNAGSFTVVPGSVLYVGGVFSNDVGGAATTWTSTTLVLDGSNEYETNDKTIPTEAYDTLVLGENTDISSWNSSATTVSVPSSSSWYSQDHAGADGDLNIYGDYHISTTTEYWSYATDFDGTDLSGSERVVTVRLADNSSATVDGGSLQIVGEAGNETNITNQGSGTYSFAVSSGALNALYYSVRNTDAAGWQLSGVPTISSLSYGDFELAVDGGSLMTLSSSTVNANASLIITGSRFATSASITGNNITLSGVTGNVWTFASHVGNLDGEVYDIDGATDCGSVRWGDSSCLITQQTDFRWRNDDGNAQVPDIEWMNTDWAARQPVRLTNADAATYTDVAVQVTVPYDSDMRSDFDDLRFTDNTGTTTVPYWIGSSTDSTIVEVWVQVPTMPAESDTVLYMYYNNPSATSSSDLEQVFVAADDFEDNDIAEYTGQTALFATDASFAFDGTYGLGNAGNESSRATLGGMYRFDQSVSQGETIRYQQYVDTSAGTSDETCVLFGVQSPGSTNENYAVCIEQFGTDRITLVRDAVENDASGTIIGSSTVTYTTGWYEVEVDWRTNDTFDLRLYNDAGTQVTSFSASDSTYTTGGYGFTFWFHNGGWDSFSSRPTMTSKPNVRFGAEQSDGGATWAAEQNTAATFEAGDTARLRLAVENSGGAITAQRFALEYVPKGSAPSCEAVSTAGYLDVPVQSSCGLSPVCMQTSTEVTNGETTVDLLNDVSGQFTAGELREDPSNETGDLDIAMFEYTEIEYVITPTINVDDQNLCFRVTDQGTELDTYLEVAELTLRFDPVLGSLSLNDGLDISLSAGTTTEIIASTTVTDLNGIADIVSATTTFYKTSVGAACSPDDNNCYVATSSCTYTNCTTNACSLQCSAPIVYHADPTDLDGAEEWFAFMEVEDTTGAVDFVTSTGVELLTLRALDIQNSIAYGVVEVTNNTGAFNPAVTLHNIGNESIDVQIAGTDMSDGASSVIAAAQQRYATSTFNYAACVGCSALTVTPANLELDLSKPTTTTPGVTDNLYWGIEVPFGSASRPHTGINSFTAIGD